MVSMKNKFEENKKELEKYKQAMEKKDHQLKKLAEELKKAKEMKTKKPSIEYSNEGSLEQEEEKCSNLPSGKFTKNLQYKGSF